MIFSTGWLREYLPEPVSDHAMIEALQSLGFSVFNPEQTDDDCLISVEDRTNRPDCRCVLGLAREAAAGLGLTLIEPKADFDTLEEDSVFSHLDVDTPAEACHRLSARWIRDLHNMETPLWMKKRLQLSGEPSTTILEDICRYVTLELGQNLLCSAGEADFQCYVLRDAFPGEALEGTELPEGCPVFADEEYTLVTVPGRSVSPVTAETSTAILWAGAYDAQAVRELCSCFPDINGTGLAVEPMQTIPALDRACALIQELHCGKTAEGTVDNLNYVEPPRFIPEREISLPDGLSKDKALGLLHLVGISPTETGLQIPSWRGDLRSPADLNRELRRLAESRSMAL